MKDLCPDNDLQEFYENRYYRDTEIASIPRKDDFIYGQIIGELQPYLREGAVILDLGCNNGNLSLYMSQFGCTVMGIDYAKKAVETARRSASHYHNDNIQFVAMDFLKEWSWENRFDFVLCSHVLEHVPEDIDFLKKICFAMKPGAHLLLFTPTVHSSLMKASKLLTGQYSHDEKVGHLRRYSKSSIQEKMAVSGFVTDKIVYLDAVLRDWFMLFKPLKFFNRLWNLPLIRTCFNKTDYILAQARIFPAAIGVHATKK